MWGKKRVGHRTVERYPACLASSLDIREKISATTGLVFCKLKQFLILNFVQHQKKKAMKIKNFKEKPWVKRNGISSRNDYQSYRE